MTALTEKGPLVVWVRLDELTHESATYTNPFGNSAVITRDTFDEQGCPLEIHIKVEVGGVTR